MLMKLIFLVHLTFSLQGDKTRKTKLIRDSAGSTERRKKYVGSRMMAYTIYLKTDHGG